MKKLRFLPAVLLLVFAACEQQPSGAVGQLVSDRIEITAESSEPIVAIQVTEGDRVMTGQSLIVQDDERIRARLAEAEANRSRIEALLEEQQQGPRVETIMAARAQVEERQIELAFRSNELQRLTELRQRNLTSVESLDLAKRFMDAAEASLKVSSAQLQELEAGTRPEQIQQTRYSLQQAQAQWQQLQIEQQRLTHRAPVPAFVDALPFEVGERPPAGAVIAVLLSGDQPHARVYVPETYRVAVAPGDPVKVRVDGLSDVLNGTVRRIANEASFTPYFALTEKDRSRLTYVAEISLPELAERLPDGVPLEAFFADMPVPDDE
jgi:HlyD family secretion protein